DSRPIVGRRQHQHRDVGPFAAQLREQLETILPRQCKIEKREIDVRMARKRRVRIRRIVGLNEIELRVELSEDVSERFLNERMIVDDENLHLSPPRREDVHADAQTLVDSLYSERSARQL